MTQETMESESFASLFEKSIAGGDFGKEGEIVQGRVIAVQRDAVVIDIGGKSEGMISVSEFADPQGNITVKAGDQIEVYVESRENDDDIVTLSKEKADKAKVWQELVKAYKNDELIEGTIWPDSARPSSTLPLIVTIRSTWSCGFDSSAH